MYNIVDKVALKRTGESDIKKKRFSKTFSYKKLRKNDSEKTFKKSLKSG